MKIVRTAPLLLIALMAGCKQVPISASSSIPAELHYAPTENLEHLDIDLIGQARSTIDMDAYAMTDLAIADALVAAAGHGVRIRVYRDNTQTDGELARASKVKAKTRSSRAGEEEDDDDDDDAKSAILRLQRTPNVEVRVKRSRTLMHLKSYCVDGRLVRTGSANFSPTGEKRQDNDLIILRDPTSIQRFQTNFERLWSRRDNEALPN